MSEHNFEVGDLVRLKSGGPLMTYAGTSQLGSAMCTWQEGNETYNQAFDHRMIEKSQKPRSSVQLGRS